MSRTTFLVGAGAPLDLSIPEGAISPSTTNITTAVCEPYRNFLDDNKPIGIVRDIYDRLMATYPPKHNPCSSDEPTPCVHFEHLFHVLEMLEAYSRVWRSECKNETIFPVFAPFTQSCFDFDRTLLHSVMDDFILRITDIITQYNDHYLSNLTEHDWYRSFYRHFTSDSDYFILNYDTTIEHTIGEYEDGYEPDGIQNRFKRFNPRRLLDNPHNLSTVNHLHGCIDYYFATYKNSNQDVYEFDFHDLYKYPGYETVRRHMTGRSQSSPANQSGETYRAAPILTGLRKLDKLNCVPFDFYHANLVKCLTRNHKLVIIGYSFGDTYCNQLIDRMNYFHGDKARIVLIDKWNIPPELRRRYGAEFLSHSLGMFLCKAARLSSFYEVMAGLYASPHGNSGPLRSANGHLMVFPDGFRDAATHLSEIDTFLNS